MNIRLWISQTMTDNCTSDWRISTWCRWRGIASLARKFRRRERCRAYVTWWSKSSCLTHHFSRPIASSSRSCAWGKYVMWPKTLFFGTRIWTLSKILSHYVLVVAKTKEDFSPFAESAQYSFDNCTSLYMNFPSLVRFRHDVSHTVMLLMEMLLCTFFH